MKKTLSIIVLVAVLASAFMVFPVSAVNYDTVYKADVVFDGKLDSAYLKSLACVMKEAPWSGADYMNSDKGVEHKGDYFNPNFTATTYFLHDDENIYICAYVVDSTIYDTAEWPEDGIEVYVTLNLGVPTKFCATAFGRKHTKSPLNNNNPDGNEEYYEVKSFRGDGYYTIEMKIPKVGLRIKSDNSFTCAVQINDVHKVGATAKTTMGAGFDLASSDSAFSLYLDNKVVKGDGGTATPDTTTKAPEVTTKAPDDTTKAPEDTTKAPEDTTKAPEDTTKAPEDTTKAPDDTTAVDGEDTTAVDGEDTTVADDTTAADDDTVADDTTAAPDDTTKAPVDDETEADDTTKAPVVDDDKADNTTTYIIIGAVAAVIIIAVIIIIVASKKKRA